MKQALEMTPLKLKPANERKAYVVFLGLALAAVAADRAFMAFSPNRANAARQQEASATLPGTTEALLAESAAKQSLADRLQAVCDAERIDFSDLNITFAASRLWLTETHHEEPQPTPQRTPQPKESDAAEAFKREHILMAVMWTPQGGQAIIDTTCLLIGQEMNGFRLVSVGPKSAVLVSGAARVELKMASKGNAHTGN